MIRKLKYINNTTSIEDVIKHNDERYIDITKEFINRKNKLTKDSTEAVIYFEKLLKIHNIFYVKEKCFFSDCADLFYADFYIPLLRLTIEIDGDYHNNKSRKYLDGVKEDFLISKNIATIRFKNEDVFKLKSISKELFINKVNIFWNGKLDTLKLNWEQTTINNKNKTINRLENQFYKELIGININKTIVLYSKDNEWIFNNIFILHFSTEFKFKDILKRLNSYNKRLKYNIKYLE